MHRNFGIGGPSHRSATRPGLPTRDPGVAGNALDSRLGRLRPAAGADANAGPATRPVLARQVYEAVAEHLPLGESGCAICADAGPGRMCMPFAGALAELDRGDRAMARVVRRLLVLDGKLDGKDDPPGVADPGSERRSRRGVAHLDLAPGSKKGFGLAVRPVRPGSARVPAPARHSDQTGGPPCWSNASLTQLPGGWSRPAVSLATSDKDKRTRQSEGGGRMTDADEIQIHYTAPGGYPDDDETVSGSKP